MNRHELCVCISTIESLNTRFFILAATITYCSRATLVVCAYYLVRVNAFVLGSHGQVASLRADAHAAVELRAAGISICKSVWRCPRYMDVL